MKKYLLLTAVLSTVLCLIPWPVFVSHAQEASALTLSVSSGSGTDCGKLLDGSYDSSINFSAGETLTISSLENISGLYLIWYQAPGSYTLNAGTETLSCGENGFIHEYIPLTTPQTSVTMSLPSGGRLCDIHAYSDGTLPADVQLWEPACENADFLVFSTHSDDEILFLGGVLATYAGEQKLDVQLCYLTHYYTGPYMAPIREHEKLDGIWASGVRNYPVNGPFEDLYCSDLNSAMSVYNYEEVAAWTTEMARRFRPLVMVTQDFNGEYGHGGHMLLAKAVADAADHSSEESFYPESVTEYGAYDVPKTYFHLYTENPITLDLRQPLSNFGGKTAVEVASEAYKKHVSQQWCWFYVTDDENDPKSAQINCAKFGLYRSTVGADTGNDMLEHLTTYEEQAEIAAAEAARAEEEARLAEEQKKLEESIPQAPIGNAPAQAPSGASEDNSKDSGFSAPVIIGIVIGIAALLSVIAILLLRGKRNRRRRRR